MNEETTTTQPQQSTRGVASASASKASVARLRRRAADRARAEAWISAFVKHWMDQPLLTVTPRSYRAGVPSLPVYRD